MSAPSAPQKRNVCVDVQLGDLEADLRIILEVQLIELLNWDYWQELDAISPADEQNIEGAIEGVFSDIIRRYKSVVPINNILQHCVILLQNVVWAAMNVPWPNDPTMHVAHVINNAFTVYNHVIYAPLRTEMIMVNHNCEVLQRTWRRCYYEPDHPICRRRLCREFEELRGDSLM